MGLSDRDRELLLSCFARREGAWEEFVNRFAGLVYHVVDQTARSRSFDLSKQDRDDYVAEVFLAIVESDFRVLRRFQGRASLATYLTVVARRVCVRELLRRRSRVQPSVVGRDVPSEEDFRRHFENTDLVRHLLEQLTDNESRLVQAFYLQNLTYREISERLSVSENSIGPTLARARRKMHRWLKQSRAMVSRA